MSIIYHRPTLEMKYGRFSMFWLDQIKVPDSAWIYEGIDESRHLQDGFLLYYLPCSLVHVLQANRDFVFVLKVSCMSTLQQPSGELECSTILQDVDSFLEKDYRKAHKTKEISRYFPVESPNVELMREEIKKDFDYSKYVMTCPTRQGRPPSRFTISLEHPEPQPNQEVGPISCDWYLRPIPADQVNRLHCHHVFHRRCIEIIMEEFENCPLCELILDRLIERLAEMLDNILLTFAICSGFGFLIRFIWD